MKNLRLLIRCIICCIIKKNNVIFTTVKWLTIILSIYLIGLSVMPCTDVEIYNSHQIGQLSSDKNHAHKDNSDLCSPFCACNCCGFHFVAFQPNPVFDFKVGTFSISILPLNYESVFFSSFSCNIWQPPKI